ncbi:MAG: hypothetical protein WDA65_05490 [Christensenellales bacterium]
MKKSLISLLTALILLIGIAPLTALADSGDNEAYLMFADSSWAYQYWGDAVDTGVKATTAKVTGDGDYKIALDFTGTESGAASGIAFTAIGIKDGEFNYPNATIELKSVKVNGEEVVFTKGYTSSDDRITTRMNIYNEWVGELPSDARSFDGDISDASAVIVDKEAFASVEKIEISFALHEAKDKAYLMYADGGWTYQYWGDAVDTGVVAKEATVTGAGTYTVGLDFTGTADGAASGLSFTALGIVNGENTFPGYCIKISDIKVNGESIEFSKGYTSSDDGITTRMNIYNEWVGELPADARSFDAGVEDAGWITVDKEIFASVQKVEVTFEYSMPAVNAYIMYADGGWTYQYWGEDVDTGIKVTNATVTNAGAYKVALDFTGTETGAATDLAFTALGITNAEITHPGWFIRIDSIKVNGEDVAFTKGYTSSDDGITTRMNIYNEWVGELPADARSYDNNLEEAGWIITDKAAFASVQKFEIAFTYMRGEAPKSAAVEIDVEAALAEDYNAYFGIQTQNYIFRNAWNEPSYGKETDNWTHLTGWDAENNQVDYGGAFTDAAVDGNGTFTVGVTLGDKGLGEDETMRMLFVSTDIPSQLFDDGLINISGVNTAIDGGKGQSFFAVNTSGEYLQIDILNEYTATGTEAIPYTMPAKDVMITFTVEGLSKDSSSQAEEPPVVPEPDDTASTEPSGDSLSPGVIAAIAGGLVLVIGGIIAVVVISGKKKKND